MEYISLIIATVSLIVSVATFIHRVRSEQAARRRADNAEWVKRTQWLLEAMRDEDKHYAELAQLLAVNLTSQQPDFAKANSEVNAYIARVKELQQHTEKTPANTK